MLDFVEQRLLHEKKRVDILDTRSVLRLELIPATEEVEFLTLDHIRLMRYKGMELPVVAPEMLLLGKLIYLGDISNVNRENLLKYNDVQDFCSIYRQHKAAMDMQWLQEKVAHFNVSSRWKTLVNLCQEI